MLSLECFVYCVFKEGIDQISIYVILTGLFFITFVFIMLVVINLWCFQISDFFCTGIKENLHWPCVGENSCMSVSVDVLVCLSWAYLFVCLMWMYDCDRDGDYDDAVELCDRYERWTPWQEVHHDLPRLLLSSANRSQQFRQRELYSQQNCKLMKMYCLPVVSSDADSCSDCQLVQTVAWQPGSSE